ncbi:pyrroloquinoline quinone-dependent dehydrogenase [Pelagibacterium halotolerans]|uniref:pyrroloquinoline quinone-dependent dehydrogenase n=1 Tax=Pelagibacterium halotolerans TaxID=531813 RepID=UPI00384D5E57
MKSSSFLAYLTALPLGLTMATSAGAEDLWPTFNGNLQAQKFSTADQITPENVHQLEVAWEAHTGDVSTGEDGSPVSAWSATPIFANDTVYLGTPFYRIFALEPDTGEVKWIYDSHALLEGLTQDILKSRGVAYWEAANPVEGQPCQKRVYIGTMDAKLHSVDADTGKACTDFGTDGILDVNTWNTTNNKWPLSLFQPPTVFGDTLVLGWAGKDWADTAAPPGYVFGIDARTGALNWTFDPIPSDIASRTGTADVWASMSVDPEAGIVYLPVSSPSPNFYGGERLQPIPLATSVTALDIATGDVIWSRQLVHHDIWDYDTNAAPTLVDIKRDGETVPALVQTSKQGFLYVLNRLTGEPVFPIEERPVPASTVEGEHASPTQPFVAVPEPTVDAEWPGVYWLADLASGGYCSNTAAGLRYDGPFTPPSLEGTITYPPTTGGVEWGGGAVNPETGTYIVNSSNVVQIYKLVPREAFDKIEAGGTEVAGFFPMTGSPYGFEVRAFLNPLGMPCWNPPYGTMSAYNLNTGELLWRKPFGQVQKWGFYMPEDWGSVTFGGPLMTSTGVIFIGASMDRRVRAISEETGEVLWKANVDANAVAIPATYTYNGKQYVVFVAGGNSFVAPGVSDQVIAFALPD